MYHHVSSRVYLSLAESSRGPWTSNTDVDRICEEILLSAGSIDAAYRRFGLQAIRAGTYLATFRAVARKYPTRSRADILHDWLARRRARRPNGSPPRRVKAFMTRR